MSENDAVQLPELHNIPIHTKWRGIADNSVFIQSIVPKNKRSRTERDTENAENLLTSRLRGRHLFGKVMRVPKDYTGVVIPSPHSVDRKANFVDSARGLRQNTNDAETFFISATPDTTAHNTAPRKGSSIASDRPYFFDKYCIWQHDEVPKFGAAAKGDSNDGSSSGAVGGIGMAEWLALAEIVHGVNQ